MDIRQLSYFVEIAHQNSFTKAAQKICISQPALSKCIQNLEDELGLELFLREPGSITLTASGTLILEDAEDLLLHFNAVQNRFHSVRQHGKSALTVGCSTLLSSMVGEKLIATFLREREMRFTYLEEPVRQLVEKVFRMESDLALYMLCHREYPHFDKVAADPLFSGGFLAVVPPGKSGSREYLKDLDLRQEQFVTSYELFHPSVDGPWRGQRSVFYVDQISTIREKVLREGFIAIVPDLARRYFPAEVDFLKLRNPVKYEIAFLSKRNTGGSEAVKALKKFVSINFMNRA